MTYARRNRAQYRAVGIVALSLGIAVAARAQGTGIAVLPARSAAQDEAHQAPIFRRTLTAHLERVTLGDALAAISAQTGVRFTFSASDLPLKKQVSLVADRMTLGDALTLLLLDTGCEAVPSATGGIRLEPTGSALRTYADADRQGTASITGHVTDGALKTPLSEASVRIEGTTKGTTVSADGKYTITGVAPGTYRVTARRVGYQLLSKDVTVAAEQTVTVDFPLAATPTRLDEVVTTAVGQQRRFEVGNDISTINADSIAATAPITSLTDLISARAPGVEVLESSGLAGSGEAIRIEGLTSLVLQNDPILIVDGVRQDNSVGGNVLASFFPSGAQHPTPTRLNDLDFDDIATIDILKGPAASTEYGTDAANGVIVITTKHGTAGTPQWRVSAEQTESAIPGRFPNGYYSWGHTLGANPIPVNCTLTDYSASGYGSETGQCAVDSVTQWNPLNHAATSIFGTGDRGKYDLSVSGGSDAVRYFVSGALSNEIGVTQMPPVFKELADTASLGLPGSAFNPNSEQQRSVRVNTAIKIGPTADLSLLGSYLSTYQRTPAANGMVGAVASASALPDGANNYGYGYSFDTPLGTMTDIGSQNTDRVTGGITANWRPLSWFVAHGTIGLDHGSQSNETLNYPLANAAYEFESPFLGLASATTDVYSVDLRATATASLTRVLRAVSSVGLQMVDTRVAGQSAYSSSITATNLTLNGATSPVVTQLANRQATLGGYGEEQLSIADRLFLTGALRIDAASGFGAAYSVATYPKASVSWLALAKGGTTVRVRGAFGESGVQPMNGAALALYNLAATPIGGAPTTVTTLQWPGNPNLQPERTAEFEGGVDLGGWGDRLTVGLTAYSKTTNDALVNVALAGDVCCYTYQENIGAVQNRGIEGTVTAAVVQGRFVTWTVGVNASVNANKLVSLAPGVVSQIAATTGPTQYRQAVGYPLYGIWARQAAYTDANHDGILVPSEVTVADSNTFAGSSSPTRAASVSTHLGLWQGLITLGGLVDYQGGFKIVNEVPYSADYYGSTLGTNDPTAPLSVQARAITNYGSGSALDVENGDFVRVREVSVTYAIPRSLVRALRVRGVSLTGAVRNLALWTRYSGKDPEVTNIVSPSFNPTTGSYTVNNDIRADYGAVPLLRYWVARVNVEP